MHTPFQAFMKLSEKRLLILFAMLQIGEPHYFKVLLPRTSVRLALPNTIVYAVYYLAHSYILSWDCHREEPLAQRSSSVTDKLNIGK
jgi:hypothetical protein